MNGNGAMVPAGTQSGVLSKQEFGSMQVVKQAETAAMAIAAQAEASVRARYSMALLRPRDWDVVRTRLLMECARPSLAAVAVYSKPQGKKQDPTTGQWVDNFIEGLSIRFAEVAMRCMGNLMPETTAIYDDDKIRIIRVALTDLESNNYFVKDVVIQKTVERRNLKKGQVPLESRINSYGDPVYILPATDDEVINKENSLASKALRNHVLRILPGDLQDESRQLLDKTFNDKDAKDPDAGRKEIADGFAQLNIMPDKLKAWLGHDLGTADEAERKQLRKLYAAVKTGEMTWVEIMAQREEQRTQDAQDKKAEATESATGDAAAPAKSLGDLKKREKAEEKPVAKKAQEKQDPIDRATKEPTFPIVDLNDSGPCQFHDVNGVVCNHEGYAFKGTGYRCQRHAPEPT